MSTGPGYVGGLQGQAKSTFGLFQISVLASIGCMLGTMVFATTPGRIFSLIGIVCGVVAYFAKKS